MTEEPEEEVRVCAVPGTAINIGSTTGGTFSADLGQSHILSLNNTNLNLFINNGVMVDVGVPECLEDVQFTSSATNVLAMQLGHGYAVRWTDGTQARFIPKSYSGGTALISYQYPF